MTLTILDRWLALPLSKRCSTPKIKVTIDRDHMKRIEGGARIAKRFIFSDTASRLAGSLAFGPTSKLVLNNRQFAIPPFPVAYVEFNSREFHSSVPRERLAYPDDPTDYRIGYLWTYGRLYTLVQSDDADDALIVPGLIAYSIVPPRYPEPAFRTFSFAAGDRPDTIVRMTRLPEDKKAEPGQEVRNDEQVLVEESWITVATALGTTYEQIEGDEQMDDLHHEIGLHWLPIEGLDGPRMYQYLIKTAGDVRNFWTLMLWLNRPSRLRYVEVPAGGKLWKGKRVASAKSTIIDVDLSKTTREVHISALQLRHRDPPIDHAVRGHFAHSHGDPDCSHVWPLVPDVDHHWTCERCGRLRWWVKDHRRGDPAKGTSVPDYDVNVNRT